MSIELVGNFSYSISGDTVSLEVDRIQNNTTSDTSGTLKVELWATNTPYLGSGPISGYKLTEYRLDSDDGGTGQLGPGEYFYNIRSTKTLATTPPDGTYAVTLLVTEYTGGSQNGGFTISDYGQFDRSLQWGDTSPTSPIPTTPVDPGGSLLGDSGPDELIGSSSADRIFGLEGKDTLLGFAGADLLNGGAGNDILRGGAGGDTLLGAGGSDKLFGGAASDRLKGGASKDQLVGGAGRDNLIGGKGNDRLVGGKGNDVQTGGSGNDTFVFSGKFGNDRVRDFDASDFGDFVDLAGVTAIRNFKDLVNNHIEVSGDILVIKSAGNSARLSVDDMSEVGAEDFLF